MIAGRHTIRPRRKRSKRRLETISMWRRRWRWSLIASWVKRSKRWRTQTVVAVTSHRVEGHDKTPNKKIQKIEHQMMNLIHVEVVVEKKKIHGNFLQKKQGLSLEQWHTTTTTFKAVSQAFAIFPMSPCNL